MNARFLPQRDAKESAVDSNTGIDDILKRAMGEGLKELFVLNASCSRLDDRNDVIVVIMAFSFMRHAHRWYVL